MKTFSVLILALLFASFGAFAAHAESSDPVAAEIERASGASAVTEGAADETGEGVFSVIRSAVEKAYKNVLGFLCSLLAAAVLSALTGAVVNTGGPAAGTVYTLASVTAISGVAFAGLRPLFAFVSESLTRLCEYMSAFIPVTASIYAAGGSAFAGIAGSGALILFLTVLQRFSSLALMPLLKTGLALSVAGALPGSVDLRPAAGFFKSLLNTLLAFAFTVFGAVMYFQTVVPAAADSCAFRTVRYAAGAFIPVIGGMIGDAARTVTTAVGTVRAAVGGAGLFAVLSLVLPAVIMTAAYKLCVLAAAAFARMLGLEKESGMLYDINGFLGVLLALAAGAGVIFVLAVALFIRIGVGE